MFPSVEVDEASLKSFKRQELTRLSTFLSLPLEAMIASTAITSSKCYLRSLVILGASQRPEERRAEFIQEGEPDFVRGTEASVMHQHPLQNFEDRMERAVNYTRVPEEEEGKKILDEAVHMARHNYAKDSVGRDAMEGGDLDNESWVDDTATSRPRDQAAETDEAADYVTEELYIHAKTMIIDGKYILVHIQSVDRDG
jgi:hypothetical protein